ncbi:lanthionine synthetase LanC family protein [Xanthocytophaga agilis]|uniref:Lanthionine synthetase LanC family protein n=1 Tax=Xanthocytophaga agilis TaxID=3048010 RepID=A0AAE3R3P9_9BACT|nr:lanthionine synthetase LanC family protein [Xanthocytophaga agilis]MDJ1503291.1 lanthionine synthetase LanC family protein [Xanthocytophaga agilis]
MNQLICDTAQATPSYSSCSLYIGLGGPILLNASLYHRTKNSQFKDRLDLLITSYFDDIPTVISRQDSSLASGFAGILWLVEYLKQHKLLQMTSAKEELMNYISRQLEKSVSVDIENRDYDLLYGVIGKALVFLDYPYLRLNNTKVVTTIVEGIEQIAERDSNGNFWYDYYYDKKFKGEKIQNYGLAHGIPSIICTLCFFYLAGDIYVDVQVNTRKMVSLQMIRGAVNWLLSKKQQNGLSSFSNANISEQTSRLGWCYGDLGVAYSLFVAAQVLKDNEIYYSALEIALHSCKRNITDSQIQYIEGFYDIGICHGLAGVCLFYRLFYEFTHERTFSSKYFYYLRLLYSSLKTIKTLQEGTLQNLDLKKIIDDTSLLYGKSGACLVAFQDQSFLSPKWHNLMLLNNFHTLSTVVAE